LSKSRRYHPTYSPKPITLLFRPVLKSTGRMRRRLGFGRNFQNLERPLRAWRHFAPCSVLYFRSSRHLDVNYECRIRPPRIVNFVMALKYFQGQVRVFLPYQFDVWASWYNCTPHFHEYVGTHVIRYQTGTYLELT
jgi:hypothetical protein